MKCTNYFQVIAQEQHPEARRWDWIETVIASPSTQEKQCDGRLRYWGYIQEANKYMRIVVEPDGETVHNAFFDENYGRKQRRQPDGDPDQEGNQNPLL